LSFIPVFQWQRFQQSMTLYTQLAALRQKFECHAIWKASLYFVHPGDEKDLAVAKDSKGSS